MSGASNRPTASLLEGNPVEDALAELQRERRMRAGVYPKWIRDGRLSEQTAKERTAALDTAINIVRERYEDRQT